MVYLVGAGPGDVGLLTRRGAELLASADVVVYDGLVNPSLLQLAGPNAEIIYGGKHDRTRAVSQEDLNALLIRRARKGQRVVRLKGGDPYVLGRGGEEASRLADAGIPFEVVPGVSSAEAVPNYAGIPLTHREICSSYTVVTGHEDPTRPESRVAWDRLAQVPGTLVILMGLTRLRQITELLLRHGRSTTTPVALIRWGTTGRQQVVEGSLATIAQVAEQAKLTPPVLTIIGEVVALRSKLNWFGKRPLLGQRIVVTQPRSQAGELTHRLRAAAAEVLEVPAMRYVAPTDPRPLHDCLEPAQPWDWIVFSSPVSVEFFFGAFFGVHHDWRALGPARLGAYGPQTAAKLKELHLRVEATPTEHLGPQIVAALSSTHDLKGQRVLLLRPERASPKVPRCLEEHGALVTDVACYRTITETNDVTGAAAQLLAQGADWITFAGFPEVNYFHQRFDLPKLVKQFPHLKLATIGPKTTQLLADLGLPVAAEAATPTLESLATALEQAVAHLPSAIQDSG